MATGIIDTATATAPPTPTPPPTPPPHPQLLQSVIVFRECVSFLVGPEMCIRDLAYVPAFV